MVDNAIKYTPVGGKVQLSLTASRVQAVFEVMDSGIGIAQEDLPHIFERVYRASNARDTGVKGSGLGLAIANWIAAAHRGSLEVRRVANEATTFHLTLPPQHAALYGNGTAAAPMAFQESA